MEGIQVTLDPFTERDRTRQFFGVNALSDGIGILHVQIVNSSPDRTILVEKKNFKLLLKGSEFEQSGDGSKIQRNKATGETTAIIGAAAGSFPLLFVGAALISQSMEIQRNFVGKELPDQTLSPGQRMEGFIYYKPIPKNMDWSVGAVLKLGFAGTQGGKGVEFDMQLSK